MVLGLHRLCAGPVISQARLSICPSSHWSQQPLALDDWTAAQTEHSLNCRLVFWFWQAYSGSDEVGIDPGRLYRSPGKAVIDSGKLSLTVICQSLPPISDPGMLEGGFDLHVGNRSMLVSFFGRRVCVTGTLGSDFVILDGCPGILGCGSGRLDTVSDLLISGPVSQSLCLVS